MRILILLGIVMGGMAHAQGNEPGVAELAAEAGIGGIGLRPCADVIGAANAPILAQAGDWMLGYMAGRIDAGETLVEGEPLSAASSIDIVTSIAAFCAGNADATVLAAARRYGQRVFGTEPVRRAFETAPTVTGRPAPRPEGLRTEEVSAATTAPPSSDPAD